MGDGRPEGPALGPFGVDMDPLVVAGGLGEEVDLLLVDPVPLAVAEVVPDQIVEICRCPARW